MTLRRRPMTERESITQVHITARDVETLREVLREHRLDLAGGVRWGGEGQAGIDAYVSVEELRTLESLPVSVEVIADATAVGEARQREVGKGNRFGESGAVPEGLGEMTGGEQ
jgi:hypothetical protein